MTHNRKPCAALFLEEDYDALTLEAYSEARVTTERLKNGRFPFSCIYCKEIHKDKNMTSYHRMFNLCKVYKGPAPLKMYPTWEKSDHGELSRIAKKHGKVFQQVMPSKSSVGSKRKSAGVFPLPNAKHRKIPASPAHKPQAELPCKTSRSAVKPVLLRVQFQDTDDTEEKDASDDKDDEVVDVSEEQSSATSAKEYSDDDTPPVSAPKSVDIHCTSRDTTSEEGDFRVVKHHHSVPTITRAMVEERAWVEARLKFPERNSASRPAPPTFVDMSGLYILITEVDIDWMPKDLLEDPRACIQFLHRMVEEGTLGVKLGSAFGQWYLYGNSVRDVYVFVLHVLHCTLHIYYISANL